MADETFTSPSTELVSQKIDYQKLISENKNLQEVISALAEPEMAEATRKRISSRQSKIQSWFGKQNDLPAEKVRDLRVRMMNFVDELFAKVHLDEARELTADEAKALMQEFLDAEDFKLVFDARRKATKTMVFNSLTAAKIREGVSEPDNHNGYVEVPELKKKFCREGTGRHAPELDEDLLEKALGKRNWAKVIDTESIPEQIIPAHTVAYLSDDKLMALARKNPEILEKIRESLVVGEIKTPRFVVRDL